MAISQPTSSDYLSSPDHSLSHRVFANDSAAAVKAVVVDSSNNVIIGDGGTTNYSKINSTGLLTFLGTAGIKLPYGSFSDSTTQTTASGVAENAVTFNTDDIKSGITHSTVTNTSRVQIDTAGVYLITFSVIGKSTAPNKTLDTWLKVDGVNVANTNTVSKFVGTGNERLITVTYIYQFTAGQYFELYWWSDDTGTVLKATAAQTTPTRPACPSIILTVNMVSKE